jgi:peptide deformylase
MAILNLVTEPDPRLKQKSKHVDNVTDDTRKIMDDMLETMYHGGGVGLEAVQVGVMQNIMVIDLQSENNLPEYKNLYPLCIANPVILESSEEMLVADEGCLSLPEQKVPVARSVRIKLQYVDYNNNMQKLSAEGWLARVIQHEYDHLNGKLILDYLTPIKKDVALRKLAKLKRK